MPSSGVSPRLLLEEFRSFYVVPARDMEIWTLFQRALRVAVWSGGGGWRGIFAVFRCFFGLCPVGRRVLSGDFLGAFDGQQLWVIEGSSCTISPMNLWIYTSRLSARVSNNNKTIFQARILHSTLRS